MNSSRTDEYNVVDVVTVGHEQPMYGARAVRAALRATFQALALLLLCAPAMAAQPGEAPPAADITGVPEYRISPEDVLEISVWKEPDLQRNVNVRPDGGVSFPLAGDVQAAGLTPKELEQEITGRLQTYIPEAVVTVSVLEVRGLRIYVTGKVKSPGQFVVGRYVDVLQALTMAGGLTTFADPNDIRVLRREKGREVVYLFDYEEVEEGKNLQQNIVLHADDVVVVP